MHFLGLGYHRKVVTFIMLKSWNSKMNEKTWLSLCGVLIMSIKIGKLQYRPTKYVWNSVWNSCGKFAVKAMESHGIIE